MEEEINRLESLVAREKLRNNACRLLYEILRERKREVSNAIVDPVRRRAAQTLHRIMGLRFNQIELAETLLPSGVLPQGNDAAVPIDYLSGGEQEQIHFAVRLALADVAFGNERQLVVLDDAFTATDTARLARIVTILEETSKRFQIVLLSCHPERYRHVPSAKLFDLEEIVRGKT